MQMDNLTMKQAKKWLHSLLSMQQFSTKINYHFCGKILAESCPPVIFSVGSYMQVISTQNPVLAYSWFRDFGMCHNVTFSAIYMNIIQNRNWDELLFF